MAGSDVEDQASKDQQAGDTFLSLFNSLNSLVLNQHEKGLLPAMTRVVDNSGSPQDNVDFCDIAGTQFIVFSLKEPNIFGNTGHPANILTQDGLGGFAIYKTRFQLGLGGFDDVDALHIDSQTEEYYFSLAPGSQTLIDNGWSAADILRSTGNDDVVKVIDAGTIGLAATDNLTGLCYSRAKPVQYLPEPGIRGTIEMFGSLWDLGRAKLDSIMGESAAAQRRRERGLR